MSDAAPPFDARRLIADLKTGDPRAIEGAYQATFANELGRLVLAHHLMDCGVGNPIHAETDGQLRELVGRHNAALELAALAGFGQAALAVAVLSDSLQHEENEHETRASDDSVPAHVPGLDDDFGG